MTVGQPVSRAVPIDLLSRLRAVATGRESIDVAQLHFVGLADIQRAYGERWPEHRTRIQDAAESFLRNRVGGSDLLIRGESGFLVVLGAETGPKAHAVAAQLTHGLNAFFTGELGQAQAPRVSGAAHSMNTKDIERSVRGFQTDELVEAEPVERSGASDLEWRFDPVWDVRREALSYWYVTPFHRNTGARVPGYQFETGAAQTAHLLDIDEAAFWVAEQALQRLVNAGKQALIGTTIHARSLTSLASRARILATIERLNQDFHRFRIVKIAGVTHGFPRMYLKEIIGVLRSRLPNVVLLTAWDEPDVLSLLQPGLAGIGFVAPGSGVMSGPIIAIPALMARINEASKLAHGIRARFFVEGAVTKYLALKFAKAGVDNIASHAIWPARAMAEGMERWPADRLAVA